MDTALSLPAKPSHVADTASSSGEAIACLLVHAEAASQAARQGRAVLKLTDADLMLDAAPVPGTCRLTTTVVTRGAATRCRCPLVRDSIYACAFQRWSTRSRCRQ